ncbi:hypothetical protein BGX30_006421, partial [Mortierella sp. GBA39]
TNDFNDIDADKLTLWKVTIPISAESNYKIITLLSLNTEEELLVSDEISDIFSEGDLRVDIKKITDKFFAPGTPHTNFLDVFVRGEGSLPVTTGPIRGLPKAWRRALGHPSETRPSLLFLDLPDPSTPDLASRNLASSSILEMVKGNNRPLIPVFGVSGCGKTHAVIEPLSQHWGFYFNASSDDWGSSDIMTLHSTVQDYLNDTRESSTVDRQANNAYARKTTLLLFLSRLPIFKHCLNVSGSIETFTSARWTLLQVCPHVLFKDIFNSLFRQVLDLRHHPTTNPPFEFVVHDEAQFLGDAFNGSFQSMSSSDKTPRPLLSPILHAFRDTSDDQLTLVTCGTGLSINTLFWVQSSGSGLKDSSTNFEYMEFPGWTDKKLMKAYISRVRKCLLDDDSWPVLDERLPQEAIDMLFERLVERFRPAAVANRKNYRRD